MPPIPRIQLRNRVEGVSARLGGLAVESDYRVLLTGDCDVYKPNGEPLLFLRRKAISEETTAATRDILRDVAIKFGTTNRAKYAGQSRVALVDANGVKSRSSRTAPVPSAIIGYFDRMGGRFPYCRSTAFTANEVEKWEPIVPLAQEVSRVFEQALPSRFKAQMDAAKATPADYVIKDTCFTTLTVNHNIAGRIHTDKGDYQPGFGCITVFRQGNYKGGVLCFPEYLCGVDLEDRDMILFDPHSLHAVTDFYDTEPGYDRISVVYYFREKMTDCLPPAEELARAKQRGTLETDEDE